MQRSFVDVAERYRDLILPGYTHLQRAQPVLAAHYFLAYVEKFQRDRERLQDARKRANVLPADRSAVRKAFRILYYTRPALPIPAALLRIEAELGQSAVIRELIEFIRGSKRGISGAHRFIGGADEDASSDAA